MCTRVRGGIWRKNFTAILFSFCYSIGLTKVFFQHNSRKRDSWEDGRRSRGKKNKTKQKMVGGGGGGGIKWGKVTENWKKKKKIWDRIFSFFLPLIRTILSSDSVILNVFSTLIASWLSQGQLIMLFSWIAMFMGWQLTTNALLFSSSILQNIWIFFCYVRMKRVYNYIKRMKMIHVKSWPPFPSLIPFSSSLAAVVVKHMLVVVLVVGVSGGGETFIPWPAGICDVGPHAHWLTPQIHMQYTPMSLGYPDQ